ncbi:MAG TPA: PLP-dependent aminotransferase family protein [Solirubrobacteraceae bacterium]
MQANPDFLIVLDRSERRGLRRQLALELRRAIQDGRLGAGARLPPSRALARDLGLARSVVVEAYGQLVADGYLEARQGSGTRVRAVGRRDASARKPARRPRPPAVRFVGGLPDPALFPRRAWQRHYRAALDALPDPQLGYPHPQGAPALRDALARYLGRVRGVVTAPGQIVVTTGFTQALVLICRALRARGTQAVAVEDPCFGLHREAIAATGLRPVPVPVDDGGLDVARLAEHEVGAVLVAPAHSYPLGALLSAERRARLSAWAQRTGALVIEDDYDAEFRYDRAPIGALQGLAPDRVAYGGCVSKTLTPALRLGWLAAPAWLVGDLRREKALDDMGSPLLEQLALARLIDDGGLAAHLRRVRPVYRRRRDAALAALAASLPHARPRGIAAGLHLYAELPATCDERALVDAARRRGVLVEGAATHWADPAAAPPALVLGYGSQTEAATRRGLAVLRAAQDGASLQPGRRTSITR